MKCLFEIYKDKCIRNSASFKKEVLENYKLTNKEVTELYRLIVNYQVAKYGKTLDSYVNKIDNQKVAINAKARRRSKEKVLGLRKA